MEMKSKMQEAADEAAYQEKMSADAAYITQLWLDSFEDEED